MSQKSAQAKQASAKIANCLILCVVLFVFHGQSCHIMVCVPNSRRTIHGKVNTQKYSSCDSFSLLRVTPHFLVRSIQGVFRRYAVRKGRYAVRKNPVISYAYINVYFKKVKFSSRKHNKRDIQSQITYSALGNLTSNHIKANVCKNGCTCACHIRYAVLEAKQWRFAVRKAKNGGTQFAKGEGVSPLLLCKVPRCRFLCNVKGENFS